MKKETPVETSLIQRVSGALNYLIRGVTSNDWFGPNQPIQPIAQEQAKGRAFDYPVANNIRITPRQNEGASYADLRALADNHDITRLAIETKKDQISRQKWIIQYKDGRPNDAKIDQVNDFLKYPDKLHTHSQWLRMLVEDLLVIDALAIYPRMNRGGGIFSLELLDPATINRMIDVTGRTPLAPSVAYQQILKGVPAVDYTSDELFYSNRNRRTNKIYGFSPVEQIILTINMALRRQASQLEYFTSGTVPDAIMEVPSDWTPDQIAEMQLYWDSILAGNTAERRKARFVPGGASYKETKTELLKDEFDEWLAKIISFAFSISPQALIKQMNRAAAETSVNTAEEEGLFPWLEYIKQVHDYVIEKYLGLSDVEFVWVQEKSLDPKVQADIDQIYITLGVYNAKFVRERMGIDIEDEEVVQPTPQIAEKLSKADENPVDEHAQELEVALGKLLEEAGKKIANEVTASNIDTIDLTSYFEPIVKAIKDSDDTIMKRAVNDSLTELKITVQDAFDVANKEAEAWSKDRAAELVGMKYVDGERVTNPNAKWAITETTRDNLRREITAAIEGELNAKELKDAIMANHSFSAERAKTIAITETNTAWNQGNIEAWKASGVVEGKRSILGTNENHGPDDIANAEQGAIPLSQNFQSGHSGPSYHPNCRCTLVPIIKLKGATNGG